VELFVRNVTSQASVVPLYYSIKSSSSSLSSNPMSGRLSDAPNKRGGSHRALSVKPYMLKMEALFALLSVVASNRQPLS